MKSGKNELKIELRGETEIIMTRFFNAPPELVYACHTQPELMKRWLVGPPNTVLEIVRNDAQTGGKYLYTYASATDGWVPCYAELDKLLPGLGEMI